jgi:hypothetical protein
VDEELDGVVVLKLIDEDVTKATSNLRLYVEESLLDSGEVEDLVVVQILFPAPLEFLEFSGEVRGAVECFDAIRLVCGRAAGGARSLPAG